MNIILLSALLGLTRSAVQASTATAGPRATLSVLPPGPRVFLGESVSLLCSVDGDPRFSGTFQWSRHRPHQAPSPTARYRAAGSSYSITGVKAEDGGSYWCRAEAEGPGNTTLQLLSEPVQLMVSGKPPPRLIVTPSSRQFFRGESFTLQCPPSPDNSTGLILRQLSQDFGLRTADLYTSSGCSALEGSVSPGLPDACLFSGLYSGNGGLYWCEGGTGRSNAVSITVSYGAVIIRSPHTVTEGDPVVLYCHFWNGNQSKATFFKDGVEVPAPRPYTSERVTEMTIENVTQADEGFYKCASQDGKMKSAQSWLSVESNSTLADWTKVSTDGLWKWIVLSSSILGLVIFVPLIGWLVYRYWDRMQSVRNCWPVTTEELPAVELPKTKQDMTEVQWDLSWMEMSNLLDKHLYPGS